MNHIDSAPVFIIGTERSGSNLLRAMLNRHPDIYIPHPPHIMKDLGPLEKLYGDLSKDDNFRKLIRDAARLIELHFFKWEINPDREEAFQTAAARNLYCVKAAFYEQYRKYKGVRRWGCKSTFMVNYAEQAAKYSPGAKFIHLVRDCRDVAVSARKSVFNHFHPYYTAKLWSVQQRQAIALSRTLGPENFLTLRYEDLISEPEQAVKTVCAFLKETYQERMLEYFKDGETRRLAKASSSWKNCSKPVLSGNAGKYKEFFSSGEIRLVETAAFAELEHFGYLLEGAREELQALAKKGFTPFERLCFYFIEHLSRLRMSVVSFFTDENAFCMLKKKIFIAAIRFRMRLT